MCTIQVINAVGTIYISNSNTYKVKILNRIIEYKALGYEIIIMTARNMRTYNNSVGKINANTLPIIINWLDKHKVPYDEVHVGKPWCGTEGFYVDDRAVRPDEFVKLGYGEICELLNKIK